MFSYLFHNSLNFSSRRAFVWPTGVRKDSDRQGNSQSFRLSVHQPAAIHADGQVVRRITEADGCRLLIGGENPALHHLHR